MVRRRRPIDKVSQSRPSPGGLNPAEPQSPHVTQVAYKFLAVPRRRSTATHTLGDDLTDAVSWLVLIGPGFLIPLGVLAAAAATTIAGPETSGTYR